MSMSNQRNVLFYRDLYLNFRLDPKPDFFTYPDPTFFKDRIRGKQPDIILILYGIRLEGTRSLTATSPLK